MSYNNVIINQPFGVGDLLWGVSIAHNFVEQGKGVIWACDPWIAPMAKHFPRFTLIDRNLLSINVNDRNDVVKNGTRIIPLRFTDSLCQLPYTYCMKSKYIYVGLNWRDWKDKFHCIRDEAAEKKLYYEVCGLSDGEQYNFVCDLFASNGKYRIPITEDCDNGLRSVRLSVIPGYTLIDWLMVMERATNIYAVSSSNIYLFELFDMQADKIYLYVRRPLEQNHKNYDYILSKPQYVLMP